MNTLINLDAMVSRLRTELPDVLAVYVFGSQVLGTAGAESDLDLAVLVAGYAEPTQLWSLAGELADVAGCPVDLLDLRAASTVMQYQVVIHGRRIWNKGYEAALFESFVLSEKTALDTARADVVSDIQRTGSVYGQ